MPGVWVIKARENGQFGITHPSHGGADAEAKITTLCPHGWDRQNGPKGGGTARHGTADINTDGSADMDGNTATDGTEDKNGIDKWQNGNRTLDGYRQPK